MMELGLSLGDDHTQKSFKFLDKSQNMVPKDTTTLGFCMGLDPFFASKGRTPQGSNNTIGVGGERIFMSDKCDDDERSRGGSSDPVPVLVQLDLLPFSPAKPISQLRFPWLHSNANLISEPGKGLAVNWQPVAAVGDDETEEGVTVSSPNSAVSSFQMDFGMYRNGRGIKRDFEATVNGSHQEVDTVERASSRGINSDEEDVNGLLARKKLRLTKDQSAFLEESFKEHNTLNPKQKLALAKQLNLRPRQVEVWFQNRRARTKLKQTEVDCEYLKRCCETLTEENRRLQKELQELRALKSSKPFYMQLPATTLTMCPSCERVASTTTAAPTPPAAPAATVTTKPRLHPFLQDQVHALQASS